MSMRTSSKAMQDGVSAPEASNPLAAVALALPGGAGTVISMVARAAGVALALWIAVDGIANSEDTYTRTTVFAIEAAAVAAVSFVPAPGRWPAFLSVLGGSVLLFTGALLSFELAGLGMIVAGAIAVLAALAESFRRGEEMSTGVGAFFVGSGLTAVLIGDVVVQEAGALIERWVM